MKKLLSALALALLFFNPVSGQEESSPVFTRLSLGEKFPPLTAGDNGRWLNSEKPLTLADLQGKPTLVLNTTYG